MKLGVRADAHLNIAHRTHERPRVAAAWYSSYERAPPPHYEYIRLRSFKKHRKFKKTSQASRFTTDDASNFSNLGVAPIGCFLLGVRLAGRYRAVHGTSMKRSLRDEGCYFVVEVSSDPQPQARRQRICQKSGSSSGNLATQRWISPPLLATHTAHHSTVTSTPMPPTSSSVVIEIILQCLK